MLLWVSFLSFERMYSFSNFIFLMQIGAYLIESKLGRRWSLAGSTFITAFFCVVFVLVKSGWALSLSTVGISLSAMVGPNLCWTLASGFYVLIYIASLDDVRCIVWVDSRNIRYGEYVNFIFFPNGSVTDTFILSPRHCLWRCVGTIANVR